MLKSPQLRSRLATILNVPKGTAPVPASPAPRWMAFLSIFFIVHRKKEGT